MTPQELKNSILQLAIQGKLVEQRPEEGTAEELYRQIQAEKQAFIKAGKIKKDKPLPEITDDEKPFDIPDSWKWVRFADVLDVRDGTHDTPKYVLDGIPLVTSKNLFDGYIDFDTTKLISYEDAMAINMRSAVDDYDILFAMIGTIGNPVLVKKDREFCIKNMALIKAISRNLFDMQYMLLFLQNEQYVMKKRASGGVQSFVSLKFLRNYLIPLPPLAEQKRIVAKIEELLPLVDRYEAAWAKLEDFNKRFPMDFQKSLLQMAIQGKLVEQRPEEGTGEELYTQIQAEKQALIQAGKIKKDKRTDGINIDLASVPFDIPDSWTWASLGSILNKLTDGTHKTPKYTTSGIRFVSVKDMSSGILCLNNTKFISKEEHIELYSRCNPERGDMLLSKVGTTGVPAIINTDELFSLFVSVALLKYNHKCIDEKFLYFLLKSPLVQLQAIENTRGVGNKNWVLDAIANTYIVLPPLAEQKRIVAKLEELLPLCEKMK